ncbi:MAG: DMT family transporter [Anaerolineae bacterium]
MYETGIRPRAKERPFGATDLMLLTLVLIWGVNFSVVKGALAEMSPLSFNALRFALASILTLILLRITESDLSFPRGDWGRLLLLGLVGHTAYQLLFINGLARTRAGNSSLILATTPIFVALLSAVLGIERIRGRAWLGIFLSFAGIFLIVESSGKGLGLASQTLTGDILTLFGTLCWSTYTVLSKPMLGRYSPLKLTGLTMSTGTFFLILFSLPQLAEQDWGAVSWQSWLGLIYSFSLAIALGYIVWYTGVRRIGSARTAIYSNLIPVVALTVAWFTLGERIASLQLVGAAVILVGIYLTRSQRRES